jgi:hypothetical protein
MRLWLVMLLVFLPLGSASGAWAGEYHIEVGRLHGDFTLPELGTGKPVSLSDFRGKKVLLIHFGSW